MSTSVPHLDIDLRLPPHERWRGLAPHAGAARALIAYYKEDLGGAGLEGMLAEYRDAVVEAEYAEEMRAIAAVLDVPETDVLLANFYYDALKVVLGCTAFAVDTPDGPLHGRNLDWGTRDHLLARCTLVLDYRHGDALAYRVVGWPGYIGALSGVRPGAFAVTLNAVLSDDPPAFLPPVTLLLRSVLAGAADFVSAVARLEAAPIASDCLLLVTGVNPGEMVVIERSPTRAARRGPEAGVLVVTNDYRCLPVASGGVPSVPDAPRVASTLATTSCGRFDRARMLCLEAPPASPEDCLRVLRDPDVRMSITMQSMAFRARTGEHMVRLPPEAERSWVDGDLD